MNSSNQELFNDHSFCKFSKDEKRTFRRQRYSEEWREERDEEGRTDKDYMKHQCCNWACHYEELEEYAVSRAKLGWENVLGYLCELSIR